MQYMKRLLVLLLLVLATLTLAACGGEQQEVVHEEPYHLEEVEGSEFNQVILTERAGERLGIQTAEVVEDEEAQAGADVDQTIVQQGEVTDPAQGLVRVALDRNTLGKVNAAQPARVLFDVNENDADGLLAELFEPPDADGPEDEEGDEEDEDGELFFMVDNVAQDLTQGQPVFVKLTLAKSASGPTVIPYSAVIYGLNGETWAYISPEPLTYMRYPITVDHIDGGQAFLSDGPPIGTPVVIVGASLLYGADTGVGK